MVTLPDYDVRGEITRCLADDISVMLLPVVIEYTRMSCEDCSVKHQDLILEEAVHATKEPEQITMVARRQQEVELHQARQSEGNLQRNGTSGCTIPFLPLWQMPPVLPGMTRMFNMDMLSITASAGGLSAVL